jgi:hypothetical protein
MLRFGVAAAIWHGVIFGVHADPASITVRPGKEFDESSYVHRPLRDDAALDPRSDLWVAELLRQVKQYYGTLGVNIDKFAPPIYLVTADQPLVNVRPNVSWAPGGHNAQLAEQLQGIPLPDGFAPSAGSDREAVIYQPSTHRYWELWGAELTDSEVTDSAGRSVREWRAKWGGRIDDLRDNPGFFPTKPNGYKFGTAATGLPFLAGTMTIEEQRSGQIDHPLHIAVVRARAGAWSLPAQRSDGVDQRDDAIPEGITFRLPAGLNLDELGLDPYGLMIAKAVQKYGMVVRDQAGAVVLVAENPNGRYAIHPYWGPDGILRCPGGLYTPSCAANTSARLRGFPLHKLQALQADIRYK